MEGWREEECMNGWDWMEGTIEGKGIMKGDMVKEGRKDERKEIGDTASGKVYKRSSKRLIMT